jgi:biopolymer transport protein ExbD
MRFARTQKEDPEINLIPMIDVLLVIIIFLMLTTTYSRFAELKINLPSADAERKPERANEINVVISANGQYVLQRKPVQFRDVASLAEELRRAGTGMKDAIVVVNADNNANYQSVIRVMDAARQAGYGQVVFAVEQTTK